MIKSLIKLLCFFILGASYKAYSGELSLDGDWILEIKGKDQLEFGSQFLASGVIVEWQSDLIFSIKNGVLSSATGISVLKPEIKTYSRPENVFNCQIINGSYVSKSGQYYKTPHLRYERYPVTGNVIDNSRAISKIRLIHGMDYPGNYYGVLFSCETEEEVGKIWLSQSPRVSKERGSRQSISVETSNNLFQAKVKQVKEIQPGSELVLPLIDGWEMSSSDAFGSTHVSYSLTKKKKEKR